MKIITVLLLIASLMGCATEKSTSETASPTHVTVMVEETASTTEATEVITGELFLKASAVALSVVGETDDIYLGTVPKEYVTFESDNETVSTFEGGVLTAVGVGSTTVRAVWEDQILECEVSCLAEDRESLEKLGREVLAAPKRLPPEVNLEEPCTYFEESAILGDSITYFMFQWESKSDYLGKMSFFTLGGLSINDLAKNHKNIYFQGISAPIEDIIKKSGVTKLYILMGRNDLSSSAAPMIMENWKLLLNQIWGLNPNVEIVIQSHIPEFEEGSWRNERNNQIEAYNETLRKFASENNCKFIDLAYYVQDHYGRMPKCYSKDSYHMNEDGCINWMKILRFYAQLENKGGTLA